MLHLLEDNHVEHRVRDEETKVPDAHFAMILTATPRVFADMWTGTGGASSGLQSRFVLSFSAERMPLVRKANKSLDLELAVENLRTILDDVPPEISLPDTRGDFTKGLVGDGVHVDAEMSRVVDMRRRFCLILAACNYKTQIDIEIMALGRAFIDYQIAFYEHLMPADAWSWVQRFENRIIRYFEKYPGAHPHREVVNYVRPKDSQVGFGVFESAFNNLAKTRELIWTEKNRPGYELWKLNPDRNPRPTVPTVQP
jgi:hypothetical protein